MKKGDEKAFRKLYDLYANYALRTAYFITGSDSHAADVVQETFVKVYLNIHSFEMHRPFKPWFYQILLNESYRYMKKQNIEAVPVSSEAILDFYDDDNKVISHDLFLKENLAQLTDEHRTVVILKYLHGFTEKELAEMLRLNVNTIKSRLYKARARLRELIGGERQ